MVRKTVYVTEIRNKTILNVKIRFSSPYLYLPSVHWSRAMNCAGSRCFV